MEPRKRQPAIQKEQIVKKKKNMDLEDMVEEKVATADGSKCSDDKMIEADYNRSSNDEESPFDKIPLEIVVHMFRSLSPMQVFMKRLVCRKFYNASKDKTFKRAENACYVIIYDKFMRISYADWHGKFWGKDQVLLLEDIWRFHGRPIEKLLISSECLSLDFCQKLRELVVHHNIKANDIYITPRCAPQYLIRFSPNSLYLLIKDLEPKSLVLNYSKEFYETTRLIAENTKMISKMDFMLIKTDNLWLPAPKFIVELAIAQNDNRFYDYFSCLKADHVGPYERVPSFISPIFKIVPAEANEQG